jgi:hypothetical protein
VKVVIYPDPGLKPTVDLSGTTCATGKPLRFCYDGCPLPHEQPFTTAELETLGTDHMTLKTKAFHTGYLLCPYGGLYQLKVQSGSKVLGSVTLGVGHAG